MYIFPLELLSLQLGIPTTLLETLRTLNPLDQKNKELEVL